jgi:hypothetical protein
MHEWKGKRVGQVAKTLGIPRCNRLLPLHAADFSPALSHRLCFYPSLVAA